MASDPLSDIQGIAGMNVGDHGDLQRKNPAGHCGGSMIG